MRIKAFVITLKDALERRQQVERIVATCPIETEVLMGIDGRAMTSDELHSVVAEKLFRPFYPFALRPGEIGNFLSQRLAWQTIVDQHLDAALILEDDIEIHSTQFDKGLELALRELSPTSIIKFRPSRLDGNATDTRLISPRLAPLGNTSQIIAGGAAQRLLDCSRKFDRPSDTFMQLSWITGLHPQMIVPAGVSEISHQLGGSLIQHKGRSFSEKIYRNLARTWYRFQLKRMATNPRLQVSATSTDLRVRRQAA